MTRPEEGVLLSEPSSADASAPSESALGPETVPRASEAKPNAPADQWREIAEQIADSTRSGYSNIVGANRLLDEAVREALSGPAKEIATRMAAISSYRYTMPFGNTSMLDDAVRNALAGPAKEIATRMAATSSYRYTMPFGNTST